MIRTVVLSGGPAWMFVKAVTLLFGGIAVLRLLPGPNRQVPCYRARPWRAAVVYATGTAVAATLVTGGAAATTVLRHSPPPRPVVAAAPPPGRGGLLLGVFAPGVNTSWAPEQRFTTATGTQPRLVLSYSAWGAPFNTGFATLVAGHGAEPVIQILPKHTPLAAITGGRYDRYLRSYADQARAYGRPVVLSFAPEGNGNWYSYGWTHTPAATYRAAWRHVVTVFRQRHVSNVTWLWTVNRTYRGSAPLAAYWPGDRYADWVGIDGYYEQPSDQFATVFGPALHQIRALTRKPVLITETAAGPRAGKAAKIPGLFAGVRSNHLLGLIWFDQRQDRGTHHQDWSLETSPQAAAAFRRAAREPQPGSTTHPRTPQPVPASTYTVQPGDTLTAIAARLHVDGGWQALYQANKPVIGGYPGALRPGEVLRLGGGNG